jgi:hypothetical protein
MPRALPGALLLAAAGTACGLEPPPEPASAEAPLVARAAPSAILSAYVGAVDVALIPFCPTAPAGAILEGLPVVFDRQLDNGSVTPAAFTVITSSGAAVVPRCATLRPADEENEDATVLLAGDFAVASAGGATVAAVHARGLRGEAPDGTAGAPLGDQVITRVDPSTAGIRLVDAQLAGPPAAGECPPQTAQVVRATWLGGLRLLAADRASRVAAVTSAGAPIPVTGLASHEEADLDNILDVCLGSSAAAPATLTVQAATYTGPNGVPNPATAIAVRP